MSKIKEQKFNLLALENIKKNKTKRKYIFILLEGRSRTGRCNILESH